ncbi:MAG: GMC family oxidoreductase [Pseudomonadota bacterium]
MERLETEVAVVGTGPGGACVARELAARGQRVVLLEAGARHERLIGRAASMGTVTRLVRTRQGGLMARGVTVGGSSVVFNGNAYDPPAWLAGECGMDLVPHAEALKEEIGIRPLPESHCAGWAGTRRLLEAASGLGIELKPQMKFIDPAKCDPRCDDCMLGCRRDAKWTARRMVDQTVALGGRLLDRAPVESVILENGRARGVNLKRNRHGISQVRANTVILAAGGLGTPMILRHSGVSAGNRFFVDPMCVVMGVGREKGTWHETTFSYACEDFADLGFLVSTVGAAPVLASQLMRLSSFRALFNSVHMSRIVGMFTKIGDEPGGRITRNGKIDKPYGPRDQDLFAKGTRACIQIMKAAGVDPASITVAKDIGGHPGGTAAMGQVLDADLQVRGAKNLYVCDASAFPRSPGRPPTLTILAMARWLASTMG